MKAKIILILFVVSVLGCATKVDQKFNYKKLLTPQQILSDIEDLKKNLDTKHFDLNWEGKRENIINSLDDITKISHRVSIDSFEKVLSTIIDFIDDGHSKIIHQDSFINSNINQFGFQSISDSIAYLRIGNFTDSKNLIGTLNKFQLNYTKNEIDILILDIRSNLGGNIPNVNRTLTYFLPSNTKIYENIEFKATSKLSILSNKLKAVKQNFRHSKFTGKQKIIGSPQIILWVNESIASGCMLLSYHLQNNGAFVIGRTPKGIFNTFGNPIGYHLKNSKIIYTLASAKVNLTNQRSIRQEDMLTPDYVPKTIWKLADILDFINNYYQ